ncbi:hypothetical protein cco14_10109 [Campylobacter coli 80352]|uniref:Uncharacterized protein n=1 Tax=Campylobacter coli 80352 TaxID=887288 RepID=A0ABN0EME3_CAMCO|nr:hypothetical protein CCOA0055 [Campylobacter coli RM2228]EIA50409.1 hypothetical protein cco106_05186 [Campylobacter coli 2553]EIA61053.1 hypothetical protein cco14_10109 [Campylobacter coli 80352]
METRNAPNDVKSEGLAGGIQKAANAAECDSLLNEN